MIPLLVALLFIAVIGAVVLLFAAGPARGHAGPRVPRAAVRVSRVLLDEPSPGYGVLSSPERDRRARARFEQAEQRLTDGLRRLRRRTSIRSALTSGSRAVRRLGGSTARDLARNRAARNRAAAGPLRHRR